MLSALSRLFGRASAAGRAAAESQASPASSAVSNYSQEMLSKMLLAPQARDALVRRCRDLPRSHVLRARAKEVPFVHITTKKIQTHADRMLRVMTANELISISAPQVGLPLRMFAIDGVTISNALGQGDKMEDDVPMVVINPKIEEASDKQASVVLEQCASVPGFAGPVKRSDSIHVRYFTRDGIEVIEHLTGAHAHTFQHEMDHLDGNLWVDSTEGDQIVKLDENYALSNIVTIFGQAAAASAASGTSTSGSSRRPQQHSQTSQRRHGKRTPRSRKRR